MAVNRIICDSSTLSKPVTSCCVRPAAVIVKMVFIKSMNVSFRIVLTMTSEKKSYNYCFVPGCSSTSVKTPEKLFFTVPVGTKRNKWCKAVRREKCSLTSGIKCCEDHFNLEEDVADWTRYKILKEAGKNNFKLKLKPNVLPHIFDCQPDRSRRIPTTEIERPAVKKIKRQETLQILNDLLDAGPSTEPDKYVELEEEQSQPMETEISSLPIEIVTVNIASNSESIDPLPAPDADKIFIHGNEQHDDQPVTTSTYKNFGCQVSIRAPFRSKYVQTDSSTFTPPSSPIKKCKVVRKVESEESSERSGSSLTTILQSDTSFLLKETEGSESCASLTEEYQKFKFQNELVSLNISIMEKNPRMYLGLEEKTLRIVSLLTKFSRVEKKNIYIAFRKVRLNESEEMLGHIFGLSKASISRSLSKNIPILGAFLKSFIFWPEKEKIQASVPIPFRARYSNVQSIIDCFEVEIQKPSNSLHQALTWSEYKKCNTMKFLISCTPSGFINFISQGYGGRASDHQIVLNSGYLDKLKPLCSVMADRGFKQIENLLIEKKCSLVRPPSVSASQQMTKAEVQETKLIASLRINVERVIRRIREFSFLGPHSCFQHDLLSLIDSVVVIACSLSNLQGPLVK